MVSRALSAALLVAAIAWPVALGADVALRAAGRPSGFSTGIGAVTYWVCHRRPERSFHTAGVQWPVCARCSGLYLAAPIGAIMAFAGSRRRRGAVSGRAKAFALFAAAPTVVTVLLEWSGVASMSNVTRWLAALPLGAAVAFLIVRTAQGDAADRIH